VREAGGAVLDHAAVHLTAAGINNHQRMIIAGPVDAAGQPVQRFLGQGG